MPDTPAKPKPARKQHVVAHVDEDTEHMPDASYDEVLVFGQEIDALRHILGKPGWVYAAVAHGQSFTEALTTGATS